MSEAVNFTCVLPKQYSNYVRCFQIISDILPIDYFLAKALITDCVIDCNALQMTAEDKSRVNEVSLSVFHALLQLSASLREGHTCLPLSELGNQTLGQVVNGQGEIEKAGCTFVSVAELHTIFNASNFGKSSLHPVVYAHNSLYLRRYFAFEQNLQSLLKLRVTGFTPRFSVASVTPCLENLFPSLENHEASQEIDWQKVAVANALMQAFSVIAGGPGTGKTYTVTKLLAALIMLNEASAQSKNLHIDLVAPTGKAAQRLSESLVNAVNGFAGLIDENILTKIPTQAQTIHRLLGVIPNQPHFRHNEKNHLTCDVLLVDEVSMVDLPLMQRLLSALPSTTQVILLGDADQLPSVEVGAVLSDIAPRPHPGFSQTNHDYLSQVTGYEHLPVAKNASADHCVFLTKSRRFDGKGGIGLLAQAVIRGDSNTSLALMRDSKHHNTLTYIEPRESINNLEQNLSITVLIKQYYEPLFAATNISDAFSLFSQFRFLCATRQGNFGVEQLNEEVENTLTHKGIINVNTGLGTSGNHASGKAIYHGKPLMISANHYGLGLYNGDIGIVWETDAGYLQVAFEKENGEYMWVLPSKLPEFEAVYAMTIHKTQGSEFDHVALLLPEKTDNKLLSRELLYTGITRAKKQLTITSSEPVWHKAVKSQVKRFSHLSLI